MVNDSNSQDNSLIKILFLAANPTDTARLRLDQECREIREKLQLGKLRDSFNLETRHAVRVKDITEAIFNVEPNIIHFSGHGIGEDGLIFEDNSGDPFSVESDTLAEIFELLKNQVNCVVLNACFSEIQVKAIAEHISFVIGMNNSIGDEAAIAFSSGFYKALVGNCSIEDSFKFGCIEIKSYKIPENLTPVLYKKKLSTVSKTQWQIILEADLQEIEDVQKLANLILEKVKILSGDVSSLRINKVEEGSIKIFFEGSQEGFEKIEELFRSGQLTEIEGIKIQEVSAVYEESIAESQVNYVKASEMANVSNSQGSNLIKILFLAANSTDTAQLRLDQEYREIRERLQLAIDNFVLEIRHAVQIIDITQAIFDVQPNIIHFSGYGEKTGELIFEDRYGESHPVLPETLEGIFELLKKDVNCVTLNACYSEIQAKAISKHIPFVIGMNDEIGDEATITFFEGFYKALGAKRSFEDAFEFGRVEMMLEGIPENLTPVLHQKELDL